MPDRFESEPFAMPRRRDPQPFFTVALVCESCGRPTSDRRWNADAQLWVGVDCPCNEPDEPICPELLEPLAAARSVREIGLIIREHRGNCPMCNRKTASKENETSAPAQRKAA